MINQIEFHRFELNNYHFKIFLGLWQLRGHLKERKGTTQGVTDKFGQGLIGQKIKFHLTQYCLYPLDLSHF